MKNIPLLVFVTSILAIASCHKDNTPPCENVCLISPSYDEKNVDFLPEFRWEPVEGATEYNFQLNATETFEPDHTYYDTIVSSTNFQGNPNESWLLLNYLQEYYWRVRAIRNGVPGEWSTIWKFTTRDARDGIAGTYQADEWDCYHHDLVGNSQIYRGKTSVTISIHPNDRDVYFSCPDENVNEARFQDGQISGMFRADAPAVTDFGSINIQSDSFYFEYTYYASGHIREYWVFKGKME